MQIAENVKEKKISLQKSIIENIGQVIFNLECQKPKFGILDNEDYVEPICSYVLIKLFSIENRIPKQFQRRKQFEQSII